MNKTKTDQYEVKRNGNESWKEYNLLGSLEDKNKNILQENL